LFCNGDERKKVATGPGPNLEVQTRNEREQGPKSPGHRRVGGTHPQTKGRRKKKKKDPSKKNLEKQQPHGRRGEERGILKRVLPPVEGLERVEDGEETAVLLGEGSAGSIQMSRDWRESWLL